MVVGTVSTRSTRRESIVNIEIIPKASKSTAKTPVSKRTPKKSSNIPNKIEIEQKKIAVVPDKASHEILEILKDWSDDENSQDGSMLSITSGTRSLHLNKTSSSSRSLNVDQQSLIDILEGNQLESGQIKSLKVPSECPQNQEISLKPNFAKEFLIENLVVSVGSPQIDESEIIEECVVEDNSIIIELPEEQGELDTKVCANEELNVSIEDISKVDNKLGSPIFAPRSESTVPESTVDCDSDTPEQRCKSPMPNTKRSRTTCPTNKNQNQYNLNLEDKKCKKKELSNILQKFKQSVNYLGENSKHSLNGTDEENQSVTSEDTTSQSMITVHDEDVSDNNDVQMSDSSTNNCDVIEEQIVFDSCEPIILENIDNVHSEVKVEKSQLENNEISLCLQKVKETEKLHKIEEFSLSPESGKSLKVATDVSFNFPEKSQLQQFSHENVELSEAEISEVKDNNLFKNNDDDDGKVCNKDLLIEENTVQESDNSMNCLAQENLEETPIIYTEKYDKTSLVVPKLVEGISKTNIISCSKEHDKSCSLLEATESEKCAIENNEQQIDEVNNFALNKETSESDSQSHCVNTSKIEFPYKEINSTDGNSEENTLCKKINESMKICKESSSIEDFDPASEKLQEGIEKMHIEEKADQLPLLAETTGCTSNNKNSGIAGSKDFQSKEDNKNILKKTDQEGPEEREEGIKNNLEDISKSSMVKKEKSLIELDTEKSSKSSQGKRATEFNLTQRRRSSRRKTIGDEAKPADTTKSGEAAKIVGSEMQKEVSNRKNVPGKGILDSQINSSFELALQNEHSQARKKKVQKKEGIDNTSAIMFNTEMDSNKDVKSPKNLKGKPKKMPQKHDSDVIKMDIDSENFIANISQEEGDSTSNESSKVSDSNKTYKTRTKNVLKKQVGELHEMDMGTKLESSETFSGIKKSELETDIANENSSNKISKFSKIKGKKPMDFEISQNDPDIKILQANIDATIDEVLRKYTQDDPDTPEESVSPKESKYKVSKTIKESKKKKDNKPRKDEKYESSEEVRRSDRIKTILPIKKKSHGLVRSKSESALSAEAENSDTSSVHSELDKPVPISPQSTKKHRAKSRAKSSENLQISNSGSLLTENSPQLPKAVDLKTDESGRAEIESRLKSFIHLKENQYKTDRQICKEAQEMVCDCYLAEEDIQKDEYGCGEDCLNRLLMIECGHLCQIGDRCTNKRFQKCQVAPVEVFKTEKKGLGLIAAANIPYGEFILEYIGEVLNPEEFDKRAEVYSKDKNIHFYFMSLRADAIIDATMKGNISRFINHSCDPNAETQKWTVNGELRIGFFSTRTILAGEEITFDYKFQRYGKEAQKCYCGAATCRGWLGERPDESEDEDEEEEEEDEGESSKVEQMESGKVEVKVPTPEILGAQEVSEKDVNQEKISEKMDKDVKAEMTPEVNIPEETPAVPKIQETPKKVIKKKLRKELLFEDFDQLNEDIEMVVTTGLKNQAHTLKLSRLMVRAKELDQRKKLLRVLRRGELPCRRLFLDYHGLRLMHGYMIDAQQLTYDDKKSTSVQLEFLQTKLELLQTLAVLPIQNKTMLIESKVLPAVEKWAKNEVLVEDSSDQKDVKKSPKEVPKQEDSPDPAVNEKIDEIKFLASKLLEEWCNLKESFRIPKKQRIEQMKEHEKEANRKYVESSHAQGRESSRKNDQRYRSWSRYKSERETNKKGYRPEDKDRPSAEYLKISKHERRKLFALQMELKEEERRLKQREMWRQHEMNCMMIGADPRFTAPFDPSKGFQYIWNPSIGQWQALPVPSAQNQGVFNSPATSQGGVTGYNVPPTSQGVSSYNTPPTHKQNLLGSFQSSILNVPGLPGPAQQYPGIQPNIAPMVPGLTTSVPAITNPVGGIQASLSGLTASLPGLTAPLPGMTGLLPGMTGPVHGIPGGSVPGITQPPLPALPMYQEVKQQEEDPSQVKFAGPIPPPAKLPPKWKCAKDKYGRPYYYHIKIRKSQWEPPPLPEEVEESSDSSSSETSTLSSSDSSSDSDTEDEIDDTKLLMEVKKQMENTPKITLKSAIPPHVKKEEKDSASPSPETKIESDNEDEPTEEIKKEIEEGNSEQLSSIDIRLKEQFNLDSNDPPKKKRRIGLCQEIIISPRTEEDRQQFKEDLKRYKATKEKLKRQKEQMVHQARKKLKASSSTDDTKKNRDKRLPKSTVKSRIKQMNEWNDEHAKKIKEVFRSTMATTVVGVLNAYRKPDCRESRITNTEDFKHLARKLTHFVMLKEIKHINTIDELICTDNVKAKAREYIKKYMSKFGEVYQKRQDEPDFKD